MQIELAYFVRLAVAAFGLSGRSMGPSDVDQSKVFAKSADCVANVLQIWSFPVCCGSFGRCGDCICVTDWQHLPGKIRFLEWESAEIKAFCVELDSGI